MSPYLNPERGKDFARYAFTLAKNPDDMPSALGYARAQFGEHSPVVSVLKTAVVSGVTTGHALSQYELMADEFIELMRSRSVIGQLPFRAVPLGVRVLRETTGFIGYWVGEASAKPLSAGALDDVELAPLKNVAITVVTEPVLRLAPAQALPILMGMLTRAGAEVANAAFLGDSAGVAGVRPAGILSGATTIPATGDVLQDLAALVEAYQGSFDSAAWIMRPSTAVQLHMLGARSSSSTFADLTRTGGSLFGLPCVTSTQVPQDTSGGGNIILLDTTAILLGSGSVELISARGASLEMSDAPTGSSATPTSTSLVSMFQTNSVSLRATRYLNWIVTTDDAVVALSGVNYSSST